jgi:hypothetical protein
MMAGKDDSQYTDASATKAKSKRIGNGFDSIPGWRECRSRRFAKILDDPDNPLWYNGTEDQTAL